MPVLLTSKNLFDTVIYTGLKIKLLKLGVGSLFYQFINNMYKTSRSCVRLQSGVTDFFSVHLGVKQGDNLTLIYLRSL